MGAHSPGPGGAVRCESEVEGGERRPGEAVPRLRVRALESGRLGLNPDTVAPRCVTLGKWLSFSESQYPHL